MDGYTKIRATVSVWMTTGKGWKGRMDKWNSGIIPFCKLYLDPGKDMTFNNSSIGDRFI